jgi:hypothetical protein
LRHSRSVDPLSRQLTSTWDKGRAAIHADKQSLTVGNSRPSEPTGQPGCRRDNDRAKVWVANPAGFITHVDTLWAGGTATLGDSVDGQVLDGDAMTHGDQRSSIRCHQGNWVFGFPSRRQQSIEKDHTLMERMAHDARIGGPTLQQTRIVKKREKKMEDVL